MKIYLFDDSTLKTVNRFFIIGAGSIAIAESILLLIGMQVPAPSAWSNPKNILFAGSDIILGGLLVYCSFFLEDIESAPLFYIVAALLFISHGIRQFEYTSGTVNPFCINVPLFILNNVKLFLSGSALGMSIMIVFQ